MSFFSSYLLAAALLLYLPPAASGYTPESFYIFPCCIHAISPTLKLPYQASVPILSASGYTRSIPLRRNPSSCILYLSSPNCSFIIVLLFSLRYPIKLDTLIFWWNLYQHVDMASPLLRLRCFYLFPISKYSYNFSFFSPFFFADLLSLVLKFKYYINLKSHNI